MLFSEKKSCRETKIKRKYMKNHDGLNDILNTKKDIKNHCLDGKQHAKP